MDLQLKPVILDTETTGLDETDQVISICVLDAEKGYPLLNTLIKPTVPISEEARALHGIGEKMLRTAPAIIDVNIHRVLSGCLIIGYNVDFDMRLINQSLKAYANRAVVPVRVLCLMKLFAQHYGSYNPRKGGRQWVGLITAAQHYGLEPQWEHRHNVEVDARLTLDLYYAMKREGLIGA